MLERSFYRVGHRDFRYSADKQSRLQGALVTSKFGKVRARVQLLRDPAQLHNLIGMQGDANDSEFNRDPMMGCDPELFLADSQGALLPAFDVLPDKQTNPGYFWDGFQAEFTTVPKTCLFRTAAQLASQLNAIKRHVELTHPGMSVLKTDVVEVPRATMARVSDQHAALGCDPSHNLYGMRTAIPEDARTLPYRFTGGHIHFGCPKIAADQEYAARIVQNLDKVLAVWSVGVAATYEKSKIRRRYYGLAGEFRLPKHGLEYRTLSNFWLSSAPLFHITFELARVIMRATSYGLLDFWHCDQQLVIDIVNNYDVELARRVLRRNEKLFLTLLAAANSTWRVPQVNLVGEVRLITPEGCAKKALQLGLEGMEVVVPDGPLLEQWEDVKCTRAWTAVV